MRYLVHINSGWILADKETALNYYSDNKNLKKVVEIRKDEMILIFGEKLQAFEYDKEIDIPASRIAVDYIFKGKIFGKYHKDINVYKKR